VSERTEGPAPAFDRFLSRVFALRVPAGPAAALVELALVACDLEMAIVLLAGPVPIPVEDPVSLDRRDDLLVAGGAGSLLALVSPATPAGTPRTARRPFVVLGFGCSSSQGAWDEVDEAWAPPRARLTPGAAIAGSEVVVGGVNKELELEAWELGLL
jgi:hypothetical protein